MASDLIDDPDDFFALAPTDRQYVVLGLPESTPAWKWLLTPTAVYEGYKRLVVAPGAPPVVPITGRVAENLQFPQGPAQHGRAYRAHPRAPDEYLSVASFHPQVLRDKFEEALALTIRLGASSVKARFHSGRKLEFQPTITLAHAPETPVKAEFKSDTGGTYKFSAALVSGDPALPESLRWLDVEPSWRALVDLALDQRVEKYSISVEVGTDFGLTMRTASGLKAGGVSIGGDFKGFKKTSYSLEASFK